MKCKECGNNMFLDDVENYRKGNFNSYTQKTMGKLVIIL